MKLIASPKLYYLGNDRVEIGTTRIHRILIKLHLIDFKKYYNRQCPSLDYSYDFENATQKQRVYTLRTYNNTDEPGQHYYHLGVFSSKKSAENFLIKYSSKLAKNKANTGLPVYLYDHAVIEETIVDYPEEAITAEKYWFYRYIPGSTRGVPGRVEAIIR